MGRTTSAPSACTRRQIPERWKHRPGSLQLASVTTTRRAPATSGAPEFERAFRIQQNTLEQLMLFLPSLWLFAALVSDLWAGAAGLVWVIGRILYALGYARAAEKRSAGFGIAILANLVLLIGALVGWLQHG